MRTRHSHSHGRLWQKAHLPTIFSPLNTIEHKFGADLEGDAFLRLEAPRKKRKRPITLPQIKGWTK